MLLDMSKQLVYAFPGFYNKETIYSNTACLNVFCQASGQKVSLRKSSPYFSKNVDPIMVKHLSRISGIPVSTNLGRCLGVSSIHGRVNRNTFQHILDKVRLRLDGWKAKYLSLAGLHVLAQTVISSIPMFAAQSAFFPKSLALEINKKLGSLSGGHREKK